MLSLRTLMLFLLVVCAPLWPRLEGSPEAQKDKVPTEPTAFQAPAGTQEPQPPSSNPSGSNLEDSTKLEIIKSQKANYPPEAAQKGIQGQVWVKILISETGEVENVEVISGDPVLAKAAVEAARKWTFKPFIKNGKPVKVSTKLPFDFAFSGNISDKHAAEGGQVQRVDVSPGMLQGLLIHKVQPVYPEAARQNRIQGTVLLHAMIGKDGRVLELTPISGPKELLGAAIGAVQQWRYKPYAVNNEAVEVQTQITVNFQLK
jgi:TonB family protein